MDVDCIVAISALDIVDEAVFAVLEPRDDLARLALGIGEHVVDALLESSDADLAAQLDRPIAEQAHRRHHRFEIAPDGIANARIVLQQVDDVLVQFAGTHELRRADADSLL